MAYLFMKRCKFETALKEYQRVLKIEQQHLSSKHKDLQQTVRMINELNYQLLKFPRIWEALVTSLKRNGAFKNPLTCHSLELSCLGTADTTIDTRGIDIKPPQNSSKMAGHKVAYA